jgi:PPK2 family polyphosphate:nucleotide phosphotransferase
MTSKARGFRVEPGASVDLKGRPTRVDPPYASKAEAKQVLETHVRRLGELQEMLYATNKYALLIIFQAMDAAGKDGCIKHVMTGVNPQGCDVYSYAHPSAAELKHDFLWRTTRDLPARGKIVIFNRSYYEEVLVARVHPDILAAEAVSNGGKDQGVWKERFRSITGLERHLCHNGTRILKFFLHVSKDEQRKRLLERIDTPAKTWKITLADIAERKHWKQYRKAYEACLEATSTDAAPWYVIPADDKAAARLFVSEIILDTMAGLDLSFPPLTAARKTELSAMRAALAGGEEE